MNMSNTELISKKFVDVENSIQYQNLYEIDKNDIVKELSEKIDNLGDGISLLEYPVTYWIYTFRINKENNEIVEENTTDMGKVVGKWWVFGGNYTNVIQNLMKENDLVNYAKRPAKRGVTCFYCTEENITNLGNALKDIIPKERWSKVKFKYDVDTLNNSAKSKFTLADI